MINSKNNRKDTLVENIMIFFLFILFLFFESLKNLSELISYGIFKKEILTTKSNLGVDIKIKIK